MCTIVFRILLLLSKLVLSLSSILEQLYALLLEISNNKDNEDE